MSHRMKLAAAAVVMVVSVTACWVTSVMGRVLHPPAPTRLTSNHHAHTWLTNYLAEEQQQQQQQQKEGKEDEKENNEKGEALLVNEGYYYRSSSSDSLVIKNEERQREERHEIKKQEEGEDEKEQEDGKVTVLGGKSRKVRNSRQKSEERARQDEEKVMVVTKTSGQRMQRKNERVVKRSHQPAQSFHHLQQPGNINNLDYLFKSALDYPPETQLLMEEDHHDPETTPGLFQGDMVGLTPESLLMNVRVGLKWEKFPERKWTNATVPYSISDLYGSNERQMIQLALHTLDFLTCIKFVPWDEETDDYLLIWPMERPRGCWSFVGKKGGRQILSLQPPDSRSKRCFRSLGKPIHEILHALGMFHEHARPDRDGYVDIVADNVVLGLIHNFNKQSAENTTLPYTYDYDSVMHYGPRFFSLNRKPTIVPKKKDVTIGQRLMLSKLDCMKLNDLYGCLDDPFDKEKYTTLCKYLGY